MATKAAQIESALSGYLDESGRPLASGKVYTYEAGTTTPKATYQDVNKVTPHANPVILDDQGQKLIYADGLYKLVIKDSDDNIIETRDNLQYFYISSTITTTTEISAADSTGITLKDDGGNTGITLKDGGNVGIKSDTNPQTALGVADSDTTAYASTISVTSVGSDIVRIRNLSASAAWAGIQFEVGSGNVGMTRLITKKDASDETTFYIQLKDSSAASVTTQQLALSSEGDLTIGNSLTIGSMVLNGTSLTLPAISISGQTISSSSGDINITPNAGDDVVIDSHFEFDGNLLTALTNNNTIITAYTGTNITIENVTFDGGVVDGVTTLTMSSDLTINTNKFTVAGSSGNTVIAGTASITGDVTVNTNKFTVAASSGNTVIAGTTDISGIANIGAAGSNAKLNVLSTTEQVRVLYDASNYYTTTVSSLGAVTFNAVGSSSSFTFSDNVGIGSSPTSLGTNITTLEIKGGSAARTGGVWLRSSDNSVSYAMYGDTANSASNPMFIGTISNHGFRFITNNTAVAAVNASGNVGIGTGDTISARLHAISTTEQLRLGYDVSNYLSVTIGSTGGVTLNAVGSGSAFTFSDAVTVSSSLTVNGGNSVFVAPSGTNNVIIKSSSGNSQGLLINNNALTDVVSIYNYYNAAIVFGINNAEVSQFNTSGNLGVGTGSTVSARIHSLSTTEQLRLGYNASNYLSVTVSSSSVITWGINGTKVMQMSSDGKLLIGSTSSTDVITGGINLSVGSTAGNALSVKISDLAHGVTTIANTDTGFYIKADDGGQTIGALCDIGNGTPLTILAIGANPIATAGNVIINSAMASGTGTTTLTSSASILTLQNNGTTKTKFSGVGGIYSALSTATFEMIDAGTASASTSGSVVAWVEVKIGGTTRYIKVYDTK